MKLHKSIAVCVTVCGLATACPGPTVEDLWLPEDLTKAFQDRKWVLLFPPDSKFAPGSIITASEQTGPLWIGDVRSCNIEVKVVQGSSPPLNLKRTDGFNVKLLLGLPGVTGLGAEADRVKTVDLKIQESGGDAIDLVKFQVDLSSPANAGRIPQVCKDLFAAPDHYLVREAYRISKATFSLKGEGGAKIKVDEALIAKTMKLGGEAGFKITGEGDIAITKPLYLAVREAQSVNGIWRALGTAAAAPQAAARTADAVLMKYYETARPWQP